ncbi:MAG: P-loop NTPase [Calditrichaeota bacterium]|nr:P-loop NTPase [Calditrichota bacterium]
MTSFFVRSERGTRGPIPLDVLREMARRGQLGPDDQVWSDEDEQWVQAVDVDAVRRLFSVDSKPTLKRRVVAVASGKGGVGKTVVSASLASGLAVLGYKVVLVEADWGNPNLHAHLGVFRPEKTLTQLHNNPNFRLDDVAVETPVPNLRLVSADEGILGATRSSLAERLRFVRLLGACAADFVVVDLGAGTDYLVLDVFLAADTPVLVTTPDPLALQNAFNLLKVALVHYLRQLNAAGLREHQVLGGNGRPDHLLLYQSVPNVIEELRSEDPETAQVVENAVKRLRPQMILNQVHSQKDTKEGAALQVAARELLGLDLGYLGYIPWDERVLKAVKSYRPFIVADPSAPSSRNLAKLIAVKLLGKDFVSGFFAARRLRSDAKGLTEERPVTEAKSEIICSIRCPYWGDCEFQVGGEPCPVRQFESVFQVENRAKTSR